MLKKIIAWLLVVALSAGIAIGGTLAYLTDRDSEANVFTVGDVNIDLNESFDQGATLIPGVDIVKKPTIKNVGPNDAWVWTQIAIPAALDNDDASKNVIHFNYSKDAAYNWTWTNEGQWLVEKDVEIEGVAYNVYTALYNKSLKPGETTEYPVINKVYMDPHVDIDPNGDWYHVENGVVSEKLWNSKTNGNPVIYVSAYAIQKDGFDDVKAAYAAYQTQWGGNGSEYGDPVEVVTRDGIKYIVDGDTGIVSSAGSDTLYRGVFSDNLTDLTNLVIREGIRRLDNRALYKPGPLTSVTLPDSLEYIDEGAFQGSGITEIEIPENVTYMGKQSLGYCPQLENIVIRAKNVTIGNYIARACGKLKEVYIYSDTVTFESGSMYFTTTENADASQITFYVRNQEIADTIYNVSSTSHSYGMLIKSLDGSITYYNTLK